MEVRSGLILCLSLLTLAAGAKIPAVDRSKAESPTPKARPAPASARKVVVFSEHDDAILFDIDGDGVPDLVVGAEDGFFYRLNNPRSKKR